MINIFLKEDIMRKLFYIFLLSDSVLAFLSGIFISVATNIFTSGIPDHNPFQLGLPIILSAVMWLIAGTATMIWSVIIKPVHDLFQQDSFLGKKGENNWCGFLFDKKRRNIRISICICLIVTLVSLVLSIFFWGIA